jgi:hypothetical protein
MTEPLPAAVAMGDQMQARVIDVAAQMLAAQDLNLSEQERLSFDIGVQAGLVGACTALREMGLLR